MIYDPPQLHEIQDLRSAVRTARRSPVLPRAFWSDLEAKSPFHGKAKITGILGHQEQKVDRRQRLAGGQGWEEQAGMSIRKGPQRHSDL